VCLNSNPVQAGLQKNSAPDRAAAQAEVQGLEGLAGACVKFGKGIEGKASESYSSIPTVGTAV